MTQPTSQRTRWSALALIMTGVFLSTMDSGMVNVALPTMMRYFAIDFARAELIVTLYLLTITATLVLWGRLADRLGRGNVYLGGMFLFAAGGGCCYLAGDFFGLLASRIAQAAGAAMMMSSGPAIIRRSFPEDHLGRSLGLVGIATACGLLTGPYVSGLLLSSYSWRSIFLLPLPVCLFTLAWAWGFLRPTLNSGGSGVVDGGTDWLGIVLWMSLVVCGITALHRFELLATVKGLLFLCFFIILLVLFIIVERRVRQPIMVLHVMGESYYVIAIVTAAISFGVLFSVLVLVPLYLDYILGLPVARMGEVMMAVPATLIVLSPLAGWLYDRMGARLLTTAGLGLSCIGLVSLITLSQESSLGAIILRLALIGAGQSVFLSPNSASVLSRVDEEYLGLTAGIMATARNLGMVAGATIAASLFSFWYSYYSGGDALTQYTSAQSGAFLAALRVSFTIAAGIGFTACMISARRRT